jgi:uncharacterized damage-inducible protein DinB
MRSAKRASFCCAVLVLAAVLAQPLAAQEAKAAAAKPAVGGVRGDILRQIDEARDKLTALAEATPADKFTWRPNDKVRTIGEVYAHVAGGNYFLPTLWGVKPPAGVDPRGFDKDAADKAKTLDNLKKSFEHVHQVIESATDADLDKTAKLFGRDGTVREGYLIILSHSHEHLGQSIAYARSVGIVPPWSQ